MNNYIISFEKLDIIQDFLGVMETKRDRAECIMQDVDNDFVGKLANSRTETDCKMTLLRSEEYTIKSSIVLDYLHDMKVLIAEFYEFFNTEWKAMVEDKANIKESGETNGG